MIDSREIFQSLSVCPLSFVSLTWRILLLLSRNDPLKEERGGRKIGKIVGRNFENSLEEERDKDKG